MQLIHATGATPALGPTLGLLTGRQTKGPEEAGEGDTALPQLHGGGMHALAPLVIEHRTLTVHDDLEVSEQVGLMARLP
jgi:hypothetical protein